MVMSKRSVNLTKLFLGRLGSKPLTAVLSADPFAVLLSQRYGVMLILGPFLYSKLTLPYTTWALLLLSFILPR